MKEISINAYGLSTMCRLCLSRGVTVLDVFTFSTKMMDQVANVIMDCAPIQIIRRDGMPNFICQSCYTQLMNSHQFQKQVLQADKTLRRYLQKLHASGKQIKAMCSNQEPSNVALICNIDAEITMKCESLEMHDVCQDNSPENFNSAIENINDNLLKYEIKDELMDIDLLDCTEETQETLSKDNDNNIICQDSNIKIGNSESSESMYCANMKIDELANSKLIDKLNEDTPFKSTIKDEPTDDNSLIIEYVEGTKETLSKRNFDKRKVEIPVFNREKHQKANMLNLYQCFQCNKSFESTSLLKRHRCDHNVETSFKCDICNKQFVQSQNLQIHKRTHTGEKPYQCDVCNRYFSQKGNLKIHKLTHTGEKPHKCNVCNKQFVQSRSLKIHKRTHTGEKPYQCDVCNQCFSQTWNLKIHKRRHAGEKPHKCDVCNKQFVQSQYLQSHKRTHTGEKPYQCDVCNQCFSHRGNLNIHKRTHAGEKPHKCDVCNKQFVQSQHLQIHKRTHTGEKPYQCDVCNQCFSQKGGLISHKRTHTGEKPYQCDVCNQCFSQTGSLKTHKRTHTGEKSYQCDVCNKYFNQLEHLKIHKRSHTAEN